MSFPATDIEKYKDLINVFMLLQTWLRPIYDFLSKRKYPLIVFRTIVYRKNNMSGSMFQLEKSWEELVPFVCS